MTIADYAADLIRCSIDEKRTVTAYPETVEEFEEIVVELTLASDGETESAEHSGCGYSDPESNGWLEIWSEDGWSVDVIRPE